MKEEVNSNKITIVFNGKKHEMEIDTFEQEEQKDEFPWLLPEEKAEYRDSLDDSPSSTPLHLPKKKKRRISRTFRGLVLSITAAITIGLLFGFVLLSLFTEKTNVLVADEQHVFQHQHAAASEEQHAAEAVQALPVQAAPLSVYVVQAGAFSTAELADNERQNIAAYGYPAEVFSGNSHYLFIGIGMDKQSAEKLGENYTAFPQEVYIKQYIVEGPTVPEDVQQYLESGLTLFHEMLAYSVSAIVNGTTNFQEIKVQYEQWNELAKNGDIANFQSSMSEAYHALKTFAETNERNLLWEAQQYLLQCLKTYESF